MLILQKLLQPLLKKKTPARQTNSSYLCVLAPSELEVLEDWMRTSISTELPYRLTVGKEFDFEAEQDLGKDTLKSEPRKTSRGVTFVTRVMPGPSRTQQLSAVPSVS